jgi:hypothetical protein
MTDPIPSFPFTISATLARRLAEAADGFRNIDPIYIVANNNSPHLIEIYKNKAAADAALKDKNSDEWGLFGPFQTPDGCILNEIEQIEVKISYKDKTIVSKTFTGEIDSIFFNLSAVEKFVIPYYVSLYGAEYGFNLLNKLKESYTSSREPGRHKDGTSFVLPSGIEF